MLLELNEHTVGTTKNVVCITLSNDHMAHTEMGGRIFSEAT